MRQELGTSSMLQSNLGNSPHAPRSGNKLDAEEQSGEHTCFFCLDGRLSFAEVVLLAWVHVFWGWPFLC